MFRYFACLWNPASSAQNAASAWLRERLFTRSPQWREALNIPGLHVACADEQARSLRAICLNEASGIVLGTLFERPTELLDDSVLPHAHLDVDSTHAIVRSQGQHLIDHYWGNYVALVRDPQGVTVLVSPSSTLPCLSIQAHGVTVVLSCMADAVALGAVRFTASHIYMRDRVLGRLPDSGNPLNEVTRLLRGESLRVQPAAQPPQIERCLAWHPRPFAETAAPIEDPAYAASAMRSVVRACTRTLAADHDQVLLRLSGGLDSSIVAGCLRDMPTGVTAHTYFAENTSADVRPWARLAATHCGVQLLEHAIDTDMLDLTVLSTLALSADSVPRLEYLRRTELERALCREHGATAIFTGDGGDSGFCSDSVALAVVEYLKRHGLRPRVWSLAHQVSLATHRSTWQVLRRSVLHWHCGRLLYDLREIDNEVCQLVEPELWHNAEAQLDHPWFRDRKDVPWGMLYRLGTLVLPPQGYDLSIDADAAAPQILQPLYSQPVIELLLRIPLYTHFDGGRDRGLARRAFAQEVPQPILQRQWKDRAPGFLDALISRHRPWLRERLLDGVLVNAHLLDRRAMESALSPTPSKSTVNPAEIIRHLDTELWAQQWCDLS